MGVGRRHVLPPQKLSTTAVSSEGERPSGVADIQLQLRQRTRRLLLGLVDDDRHAVLPPILSDRRRAAPAAGRVGPLDGRRVVASSVEAGGPVARMPGGRRERARGKKDRLEAKIAVVGGKKKFLVRNPRSGQH